MALKRQPIAPYTLPGSGGSQTPGKKLRLVGGAQEEVSLPAKAPHPAPPFQQARRPGIPWGPTAHWVCDLGRLLLSRPQPPHCTMQEVAHISQVSPLQLSSLSTQPCPLSSPESGPHGVSLGQLPGGVPEDGKSELGSLW